MRQIANAVQMMHLVPGFFLFFLFFLGVRVIREMILSISQITRMTHLSFHMLPPPSYVIREKLPRNQDVHAFSPDNQMSFEM